MTAPAWLTEESTRWFRHPVGVEWTVRNGELSRVELGEPRSGIFVGMPEDQAIHEAWEALCVAAQMRWGKAHDCAPEPVYVKPGSEGLFVSPGHYWCVGPGVVRCEQCEMHGESILSTIDGRQEIVPCSNCQGTGFLNPDNHPRPTLIPEDDESLAVNHSLECGQHIIQSHDVGSASGQALTEVLRAFLEISAPHIPGLRAISAAGERWDCLR